MTQLDGGLERGVHCSGRRKRLAAEWRDLMCHFAHIKQMKKVKNKIHFKVRIFVFHLACCKMIPVRIGLGKVFCREQLYWQPTGHSSFAAVLQGNVTLTAVFKRFYLFRINPDHTGISWDSNMSTKYQYTSFDGSS